ncbi:hypothetical protein [Paenibacillus illinoisensis]|uniref:Extracellular solute-binding protein family 1 n=1 Tax=Paenibacillus illinoisensis TaxID=59845 RepID=A0A2W0CQG4_9BACL|nr:hypothetical protein [Paenibacillus illinoisensis]PYY25921.1 Extracellular solute-binding protein family 1 [Paenibacillus illinoisensis]
MKEICIHRTLAGCNIFSYTDGDKLLLEKDGVETFAELFSTPDERPLSPARSIALEQGSPEQIFITKADDLQKKFLLKMIMESPVTFESTWNDYMGQLN